MVEKAKRVLNLGKKTCLICEKSFQPASGAQMTCSEACKTKAKAQGLTKRGPRNRSGVDPALEGETPLERMRRLDKENPIPHKENGVEASNGTSKAHTPDFASQDETGDELPDIEMDMAPLARWIRQVVHHAVKQELTGLKDSLAPQIKAAVDETIKEKFRGILER